MTVQKESGYIEWFDLKEPLIRCDWSYKRFNTELYKVRCNKIILDAGDSNYVFEEEDNNKNNNIHHLSYKKQHNEGYFTGKLIYVDDKNQVQIYYSRLYIGWSKLIY